jgi:acetyl esterase/lipase
MKLVRLHLLLLLIMDHSTCLLTKRSLALSLSPPRISPRGSLQHALWMGRERDLSPPRDDGCMNNEEKSDGLSQQPQEAAVSNARLQERLQERRLIEQDLLKSRPSLQQRQAHPHLPIKPDLSNQLTRWMSLWVPMKFQHAFRDSGGFRSVSDGLVALMAPSMALSSPKSAMGFLELGKSMRRVAYGPHSLQFMDIYQPVPSSSATAASNETVVANDASHKTTDRIIVFVHGGAWGSGAPWMYRLLAGPLMDQGYTVVIPSYRVYPDGRIDDQIQDLLAAIEFLHAMQVYNDNDRITLMGHSSGAHVGLLALVQILRERVLYKTASTSDSPPPLSQQQPQLAASPIVVDSFIGLSGPYDINHHFDFEAGRGVEEISPMKPVNGYNRANFQTNSPARLLQQTLAELSADNDSEGINTTAASLLSSLLPKMLLVHGMEDSTVPFTATAEAARILRSVGGRNMEYSSPSSTATTDGNHTKIEEMYIAKAEHGDTVVQLMLGGPICDSVLTWIQQLDDATSDNGSLCSSQPTARRRPAAQLLVNSRL